METLRDRLAAKKRRRVVVPVELDSPSPEALEQIVSLQRSGLAALEAGDLDGLQEVQRQVEDLRALTHVDVTFVALSAQDWEKIVTAHPSPEGDDAGVDAVAALPVLAALCAEDESLQDDDVWRALLAEWGRGETLALWGALLRLNTSAWEPHVPKG
jgi:MoxR-like ATPase